VLRHPDCIFGGIVPLEACSLEERRMDRSASGNGGQHVSDATTTGIRLEESDLRSSLAGLAQMIVAGRSLDELLVRVALFASQAIRAADGASVALANNGKSRTVVASASFVQDVDEIQYALEEGPCVSALKEHRPFRSDSLSGDGRWPRFGPRAGRLGVHSALSLPLLTPDREVGALNIYARQKQAFDREAERLGALFAVPAAVSVDNATVLSQAHNYAEQMQAAAASHAIIDQAIGVMIARSGSTDVEALEALRRISQKEGIRMVEAAGRIVAAAQRRARERRRGA
jgi:GAF domain-containing protein